MAAAAPPSTFAANTFAEDAAPGGGGSGYLAAGLKAAAVAPNLGDGFITVTYTLRPTITATSSTVVSGNAGTTTVSGLPANQAFSLRLAGTGATIYTGTANAAGTATVTFAIPKGTAAGSYRLDVVVDGITEATSTPITVTTPATVPATVTTATTGTTSWPSPAAPSPGGFSPPPSSASPAAPSSPAVRRRA